MFVEIAIIVLLGCIVFAKSVYQAGAVSDDIPAFQKKLEAKNFFWKVFHTIRGNKYWDMRWAHIMTSGQHILNSVLMYLAFGNSEMSFLASCMFLVNPVNSQVSVWPSGRPYANALTFILLMFLIPYGAGIFWIGGLWGSTSAILSWVPFILIHPWWLMLSSLPIIWYGYKRVKAELDSHDYLRKAEVKKIHPKKIIIVIKTFGFYVRFALAPLHLGWDQRFLFQLGHSLYGTKKAYKLNTDFWWGLFCTILFPSAIYYYWNTPISFGLIWFVSNILCWCNIISGSGRATERYVYVANVGIMYAVAALFYHYGFQELCLLFIGAYAIKLYMYSHAYQNPFWHIEYIKSEQPKCVTGWLRCGCDSIARQDFRIGMMYLQEAMRVCEGDDGVIMFNLAVCYLCLGDLLQARAHYEVAKIKIPRERTDQDYSAVLKAFEQTLIEADMGIKAQGTFSIKSIQLLSIN